MSTASPQFVRSGSPSNMTFRDATYDPFLSAPFDPEEASFKSSAIRLTPVPGEGEAGSTNGDGQPASLISPSDNFSSNISSNTSPGPDFISDSFRFDSSPGPHDVISPQAILQPPPLMTPNHTNQHSPSSTSKNPSGYGSNPPQPLTLITTPPEDCLGVDAPDSAMARSPIVKVESVSRGDSPDRLSFYSRGRSAAHLSPGDQSSESGGEGPPSNFLPSAPFVPRGQDGSWVPNATTGQAGIDPLSRGDAIIPSPNEMEVQRHLNERNADIRIWSESVSQANSEAGEVSPYRGRKGHVGSRRRAKSAGDPSLREDYFSLSKDAAIPGPGMLIHVSSDDGETDYDSDGDSISASLVDGEHPDRSSSPTRHGSDETPISPSQFHGSPWEDPRSDTPDSTARGQPTTSTQAMVEYQRRARDLDNLSRVATWGTRPLSQADIDSVIGDGGAFGDLTIAEKRKKHERQRSLRKFLQIKTPNNLKRQFSDLSSRGPISDTANHRAEEAKSPPQRKDSFPHLSLRRSSRSPSLSTGGAVLAITNQMAAIGGKDTMKVASPSSSISPPWPSFKRGRSRSDVPRNAGLMDLIRTHGGPPVANIASQQQASHEMGPAGSALGAVADGGDDDDDDDEEMLDEKALVMEFPVQSRLPVPTMEGFKRQISQLNPRLQPALIDRFANEQLRRYRKLVECKQNHAKVASQNSCSAGGYCFAQGGEAKLLAPRASPQDAADANHTQFQIPGHGETTDDPQTLGEGAVTAAQFPPGVLLPPVKRLPAEFECPICFQVKKFQKPSDWTKHVHEDIQPFTCTFPSCTDPKSFKRKADWVRHENERHRHLEWWTCTFADCHHKCYRKDNFVQHLVREHKMPEPKVKKAKSKANKAPGGPAAVEESHREREIERLWDLVERCRHDTTKSPREEPCRFCGNVCSSWKKLTVHLAKHMEQIAMPVLGLVGERDPSYHPGRSRAESVMHEARSFAPQLEGVQPGPDMSVNWTQAPSFNHTEAGGLSAPFNPTYAPHLTTMPDGILSEEPESMETFDGHHYVGAPTGQHLAVPGDESRYMPVHQNSVTYPPAGPRLKVSNPELGVLEETYPYPMSAEVPMGQYDPQRSGYMPATTNSYGYAPPMAQSMSYDPAQGYRGQN
ncbi:hypothetical protein BDV59DRAFT_188187 [Aspergillus ambiguus]|uniref:putative C2H2 finger domain protein n=1 Tax=Aspergillus ambiguus TaxID=176160 RepID=UPI003CCD77CE